MSPRILDCIIPCHKKYSGQHNQCDICAVLVWKVGCYTIKYTTALLDSDWLYLLWHGLNTTMYFALYAWNSDVLRRLGRLGRRFLKHIKNKLKQRNSRLWRRCGYLVWIIMDFQIWLFYFSIYSLVFVLIEKISNTRDSVSLAIQTPQFSSEILSYVSYVQLTSRSWMI